MGSGTRFQRIGGATTFPVRDRFYVTNARPGACQSSSPFNGSEPGATEAGGGRSSMLFKRCVCDGLLVLLFILGNTGTMGPAGADFTAGNHLDCVNDMDTMSCDMEAQNCTEYNMTIRCNSATEVVFCTFEQCGSDRCCCSTKMTLIQGETHTASVGRGSENMGSKIIDIRDSFKPKVPTIISVKESNGNFQVTWTTNMVGSINDYLVANVTYYKKGDTEKVSISEKPTKVDELNFYEIPGQKLDPSTTYVVSVRSSSTWSGRFSDRSKEWEFTSLFPTDALLLAVTITLSVAAVIISGVVYGCYVKVKAKWWDTVASCPNPKLLDMHPSKQEVLKPVKPAISSVSVEPLLSDESKPWPNELLRDASNASSQQSSGMRTHSSCPSYAMTEPADIIERVQEALGKAFVNICPVSPLSTSTVIELKNDGGLFSSPSNLCAVRADDTPSGLSVFVNKTYIGSFPSVLHQSPANSSKVQMHAEMLCDSAYHPSKGDTYQPVPACPLVNVPPVASSPLPTDMSYQQCNAEPGRFSYADDSGLSPVSGDTSKAASRDSAFRAQAGCESADKVLGAAEKLNVKPDATTCDGSPCYGCEPADSRCSPSTDGDYQPFQALVEQPGVLFSEKRSGEEEEHFNKYPGESRTGMPQTSFSPLVPGFTDDVQGNHLLSERQRPFTLLIPVDSDYQSV